ncbi:acyl-CoA dehydrogenase family protein [Streptomyces harbinensis]|uniref:acyl-CoA dehydrogenase family protein n=2 Tax=Streptomyces TaxID=1883 RepID=UPI003397AB79
MTPAGARLVRLAERHAAEAAREAERHDREGRYVEAGMQAMRDSGFLGGCAPPRFGGIGARSLHDLMVAVSRLARGCASTAICAHMHLTGVWRRTALWEAAAGNGAPDAGEHAELLRLLASGDLLAAGAAGEPGGVWCAPFTEAVPVTGGYLVTGAKTFVTNAEAADTISVTVRVPGRDGVYRHGVAEVVPGQPGVTVGTGFDALGMRGSGSQDLRLEGCFVPERRLTLGDPVGVPTAEELTHTATANFALAGVGLGIAESARALAVEHARTARRPPAPGALAEQPAVHQEVAEMDIGLLAMRGALSHAGRAMDETIGDGTRIPAPAAIWALTADWQSAKLLVNRTAAEITRRAMAVCGGRAFLARSPLARLYRDVTAGTFMQPLAALDAAPFIGRVGLGLDPFGAEREALAALGRTPGRGAP